MMRVWVRGVMTFGGKGDWGIVHLFVHGSCIRFLDFLQRLVGVVALAGMRMKGGRGLAIWKDEEGGRFVGGG